MVDFLIPFYEEFKKGVKDGKDIRSMLENLEERAVEINERVKMLRAKKGRSVLMQGKEVGMPEPGCELIKLWACFIISDFNSYFR